MSLTHYFRSRRSDVHALHGMVATSQPLAAQAGLDMLRQGGTAADAAVATAAALNVVEPTSTGIGGDCFALYFDAASAQITALNGSGRSAAGTSMEALRAAGYTTMPVFTGASVSVPGTVAGWEDMLARHGRMSLSEVLQPAIHYALHGYPVSEWIALGWASQTTKLLRSEEWETPDRDAGPPQPSGHELLIDGRAPRPGEVIRLTQLGQTLQGIAEEGARYIYQGEFATALANHVQRYGGWITAEDMARHRSTWEESLDQSYRGLTLHECPPNGQGLAALIAVGLAREFDLAHMTELDRTHVMIECMRLAFADAQRYVSDPEWAAFPVQHLLEESYLSDRRSSIRMDRAAQDVAFGVPGAGSDTVYLAAVDGEGNACSFINSLFQGTGSGLVVPGTGVSLQNRAALFELDPDHPNGLAPGKRPYHTIIPALVTQNGELNACMGVMGGFMQPQGHFQMMVRMYDEGLSPQRALDAPRWQLSGPVLGQADSMGAAMAGGAVSLEPGFEEATVQGLTRRGHRLRMQSGLARGGFGGGQIIRRDPESGVLTGGSDPRKDGCAMGR